MLRSLYQYRYRRIIKRKLDGILSKTINEVPANKISIEKRKELFSETIVKYLHKEVSNLLESEQFKDMKPELIEKGKKQIEELVQKSILKAIKKIK